MKKIFVYAFAVGLILSIAGSSGAAFAKNDNGHGRGHGHAHGRKDASYPDDSQIGASNREAIKLYLKENYGNKKCPPGLAKKHNGCLPPGIARKYAVGQKLPDDVAVTSLPAELLKLLYPAQQGQKYVQADKDVLLIDQASRKVIDAVTLLSAVGNQTP